MREPNRIRLDYEAASPKGSCWQEKFLQAIFAGYFILCASILMLAKNAVMSRSRNQMFLSYVILFLMIFTTLIMSFYERAQRSVFMRIALVSLVVGFFLSLTRLGS